MKWTICSPGWPEIFFVNYSTWLFILPNSQGVANPSHFYDFVNWLLAMIQFVPTSLLAFFLPSEIYAFLGLLNQIYFLKLKNLYFYVRSILHLFLWLSHFFPRPPHRSFFGGWCAHERGWISGIELGQERTEMCFLLNFPLPHCSTIFREAHLWPVCFNNSFPYPWFWEQAARVTWTTMSCPLCVHHWFLLTTSNMSRDFHGGPLLRICLPMQGPWVWSESEDSNRETNLLCHSYWSPHDLEPMLPSKRSP